MSATGNTEASGDAHVLNADEVLTAWHRLGERECKGLLPCDNMSAMMQHESCRDERAVRWPDELLVGESGRHVEDFEPCLTGAGSGNVRSRICLRHVHREVLRHSQSA